MNKKRSVETAPASLVSLLHAAGAAQAHVESKLGAIGLSLPKLMALNALAEAGESLPLGLLAERLACVKSNITQLVDRLESDGFVARQSAPNDRRTRLAVMTAAGRKAWREGTRIQQEAERDVFKRLTREEAQQLAALISRLTEPR